MSPQSRIDKSHTKAAHSRVLGARFEARETSFSYSHTCPATRREIDFKLSKGMKVTESLCSVDLSVTPVKHCKGRVALTQTQQLTLGMRDYACGLEHQLIYQRCVLALDYDGTSGSFNGAVAYTTMKTRIQKFGHVDRDRRWCLGVTGTEFESNQNESIEYY